MQAAATTTKTESLSCQMGWTWDGGDRQNNHMHNSHPYKQMTRSHSWKWFVYFYAAPMAHSWQFELMHIRWQCLCIDALQTQCNTIEYTTRSEHVGTWHIQSIDMRILANGSSQVMCAVHVYECKQMFVKEQNDDDSVVSLAMPSLLGCRSYWLSSCIMHDVASRQTGRYSQRPNAICYFEFCFLRFAVSLSFFFLTYTHGKWSY